MNPLVSKILGEDAPVPVAAKRQTSQRERDAGRRQRSRAVAGVLGVMEDDSLFTDKAEEIENTGGTPASMAGMNPIKDIVAEPTDPYSNGEKVYSPASALVAPDVTPNATKPLDPSQMPGVRYGTFNSAQAGSQPQPTPTPHIAPTTPAGPNAMEILLGRARGSAATTSPATVEQTDNIPVTAESAAAMMGVQPGLFASAPVMEAGVPQPPPTPRSDIKGVCETARRWMH